MATRSTSGAREEEGTPSEDSEDGDLPGRNEPA